MSVHERYAEARRSGATLVGGHRGNPAEHPENTLRSFRSALDLGVDFIECDVHLSADGELVVIHDHTLQRTTDGRGMVQSLTVEELRRLDAGEGEKVPLLEEVIGLARGRASLVVELKAVAAIRYPGIEEKLVAKLAEAEMLEQAAVISFHHPSVKLLHELEPRLEVGILEAGTPVDVVALMRQSGARIYSPHFSAVDSDLIDAVHAEGGVVGVWVVNDPLGVAWVKLTRPDSVFTDRPAEILPQLRG
jgi:glycerophosphoryl diester phosphodiesterase